LDTRLTLVLEQMTKIIEDHEVRLREVEGSKAHLVGYGAGITTVVGLIVHFLFGK
jgi:hypothetical protein